MLSRILQRRPLRFPTRSARLANLSVPATSAALRDQTRGARLASRRWLRHPPGPRIDETRSRPWDGTRIVRFSKEDPIDRKRHWSKMSQQTRAAWIELGWNARNWDDGGSDPRLGGHVPWSEKYDWHELHPTARALRRKSTRRRRGDGVRAARDAIDATPSSDHDLDAPLRRERRQSAWATTRVCGKSTTTRLTTATRLGPFSSPRPS